MPRRARIHARGALHNDSRAKERGQIKSGFSSISVCNSLLPILIRFARLKKVTFAD